MKHTIELNGKHYDAISGKLITPAHANKHVVIATKEKTHSAAAPAKLTKPHNQVHMVAKHRGKPAKTLMRATVKKPELKQLATTAKLPHQPFATIAMIHNDASRIHRISKIQKSHLISRFGT